MTVGAVLSEAWDYYKRFFWRFVGVAAVVFVVLDLASALADLARGHGTRTAALWALIAAVVSLIGSFWVQGALVLAIQDVRDGRIDTSIGELYARIRPFLPTLIGAGVLAGIGIAIGLVLLIVPGLYLLTRWALLTPVIAIENRKLGAAFDRSASLARGHGWTVLGVVIVSAVIVVVAHGVLAALFVVLPPFVRGWIGGLVADSVTVPFLALSLTVMYFQLARAEVGLQ